jgi:quinoprotein glucose dehydrogenase
MMTTAASRTRAEYASFMRLLSVVLLAAATTIGAEQSGRPRPSSASEGGQDGEWRHYHRDLRGTRYSPLAQITRDNVRDLRVAWTWKSDNFGSPPEFKNETTPLYVDGRLYFTAGYRRAVVAADAASGETLWVWRPDEGVRYQRAPRRNSGRGVSYWSDGQGDDRVIAVTPGFRLVALNARTGLPIPSFGTGGVVDLMKGLGVPVAEDSGSIGNSSPPAIAHDTIIVGPAHETGTRPKSKQNTPGFVQAYDVRTGKQLWRFHTIPRPGEPGSETWEGDSLRYTGNTGVWAPISVDEELGYVYLPVEAPTSDWYGGHRLGDNLYASSLVALDIKTGKRIWHYQIVHHDIYDWDNTTAPILMDLVVEGRPVKAVVQLTKQNYAYAFDRVTGKPVWPIVETPVPPSDVPGERASKTQPVPTRPKQFDRQGVYKDDLVDFTPRIRAEAERLVAPYRLGRAWQPASLADAPDGTKGTITLPSSTGGVGWEHGAFDPETGYLYVGTTTRPQILALVKDPKHDIDYVTAAAFAPNPFGLPLMKPPYGRITAIDMKTGEHAWQIPNGDTPPEVRNHPMLEGVDVGRTGSQSKAGLLVTKTLLFAGEGWGGQPYFRALDKLTGEIVWETRIPAAQTGLPMTYMHEDKQYVVFSAGDQDAAVPAMLVAFTLADRPDTTASGLRGWAPLGGATWRAENDEIVGVSKGGFSYLRSTETYENVQIKVEWLADSGVNSGVLVRCPTGDTPPITQRTCYEFNLHDAHETYPTGSVMDVAAAPKLETTGRWNTLEILANGAHFVSKVNGAVVVDAYDSRLAAPGTIALQAGGAGTIRFRNLAVTPVGVSPRRSQPSTPNGRRLQ